MEAEPRSMEWLKTVLATMKMSMMPRWATLHQATLHQAMEPPQAIVLEPPAADRQGSCCLTASLEVLPKATPMSRAMSRAMSMAKKMAQTTAKKTPLLPCSPQTISWKTC